jgi:hypothetical protein
VIVFASDRDGDDEVYEPYTRKPGRLAFVPWEQVVAAFG